MTLEYLIYESRATRLLTEADLLTLLRAARRANQAQQLTGLLLYTPDGRFLQVLEGEAAPLQALYQRLGQDPRHHQLRLLAHGPLATRRFANWRLGFRRAAAPTPEPGHVDTTDAAFLLPLLPGLPASLLDRLLDYVHGHTVPTHLLEEGPAVGRGLAGRT